VDSGGELSVRASGRYCLVDGVEYADRGGTAEYQLILVPRDLLATFRCEAELSRDETAEPPRVRVRPEAVQRRWSVLTRARWRGGEVTVLKVDGDRAAVETFDKELAEAHGWPGSQHDLWSAWVPVAELTAVVEETTELPVLRLGDLR
jgi:hypothetical protein